MKNKLFIFCLLVFLATGSLLSQKESTQFPYLAGKYFGQKGPVGKAELFAPGLISLEGRYEFAPSFSPNGDELLFTVGVPEKPVCVLYTRIVEGTWTKPKLVSLSKGLKKEEMEAFFSWDGCHIFFAPYDEGLDVRIWKLDIHEDGWHNPQPLKGQIADEAAFFPTCSNRGTLYYTNIPQKKIFKALLGNEVVQESGEAGVEFGGHGFIAPDESYMLVDSDHEDSRGKMDIYVAFRNEDGGWSKPVNLGDEVNTEYFETCPTLSADGKYLFFSRYNEPGEISNIYWIDSRVIEEARKTFITQQEKQNDDFPVLKGPYLGQKPPGMTPEIFAPGLLNTKKMGAFCSVFSPGGDEFYFVYYEREKENSGGLAWMKRINDVWSTPELLHFNSTVTDNDMCMSSDGNRLIFRSWRTLPDGKKPNDHSYLWFVERTEDGWSHAKPLYCGDVPVRTGYPSLATNGILYFAYRNVEVFGIYRSKPVNGTYGTPEHVFTAVDSIDTEGDMFVAPDESYMIISCWDHPGNIGSGQGDLYITFQKDDGTWTKGINMGELINTQYGENCPQVSPDGKYFFFNRYNPDAKEGNIYWVNAKIIEDLKPRDEFPVLKGPYLGQKPPGMIPEVFAPGIVSTKNHNEALFCAYMDGDGLFLFTRSSPGTSGQIYYPIYIMALKDGEWSQPYLATFHNKPCDINLSVIPDGKTLYFGSRRSMDGSGESSKGFNIWVVKRTAEGFSNPKMLGPSVNSDDYDICPSVSKDGTLYFFSEREGGFGRADIYRTKLVDGKYTDVENLGEPVNTKNSEIDPFIAPDESYLIYCSKTLDGYGGHDLYITFRKQDGSWTEPVNMGQEINSSGYDWIPYVTSDGKYFFFTSNRAGGYNIYWVDAKIIDELRSKNEK